jgi:hypothetical protein
VHVYALLQENKRARAHAYTHVRMHARTKTALKKKKKIQKGGGLRKLKKTILKPKSTLARSGFGST